MSLQKVLDEYIDHDFLILNGYDDCVIGSCVITSKLIYSRDKIIEAICENCECSVEEAIDFMEYNIINSNNPKDPNIIIADINE